MKLVLPASHHTPFPIHPLSVREVPNDASLLAIMSDIVDDGAREKVQESGLQATEGLAETTTFNLQTSEEDCVPTSESVTSNPINSNSYTDMMLPASNLRSSRYRFPNGWSSLVPTSTIATNTNSSCSSSSSSSSNSSSDTTAMHMHTNVLLPVGTNLYAEHHQCKKQLQEVSRELDELKLSFEKMKKEKLELQARLEEMNYYQKEKIHDLTGENLKLKLQLKRAEIQQLQQQKTSSGTNGTNKTAAASANVKSFSTLTPTNSNHSSSSINAAMSKSLTANRALSQGSSTSMGSKNPITTTSSKNNNNSSSSNNIPMSTSIVSNVDSVNSNNNNDGIDQHQVSSKSSSNSSDVVPSLSSSSLATNIAVISTSTEEAEKDKEDASIPKINPFAPLSSPFLSTANNETTMAAVPPSLSSSVNPFASFTNSFLSNLGSKSIFQAATSSVGLPAAVDKPATSSSSTIAGTLATSLAAASSILPPTTATSQGQGKKS